jgi:hypothetical protein
MKIDNLDTWIFNELLNGAKSEFDLIASLRRAPYNLFRDLDTNNSIQLYKIHFIIYHALYRLDEQGENNQHYRVYISPLKIELLFSDSYTANPNADDSITETDSNSLNSLAKPSQHINDEKCQTNIKSLKEYYLDWDNLAAETAESINTMLDDFWQQFNDANIGVSSLSKKEALAELGFKEQGVNKDDELDLPSKIMLKQRYRQLSNMHHPDKGGCPETFKKINLAYRALR